jgi:hypothetical protein
MTISFDSFIVEECIERGHIPDWMEICWHIFHMVWGLILEASEGVFL